MSGRTRLFFGVLIVAIVLGAMIVTGLIARGQAYYDTYLPRVFNLQSSSTVLVDGDTTMVGAYVIPNTQRTIVVYIERPSNRLHVTEDTGTSLKELKMPEECNTEDGTIPSFVVPGNKQANGSVVVTNGVMHLYVTTRQNDPQGDFKLIRCDFSIP